MSIGQKIQELRIEKGLTLEDLGNMVGVGKSTVRKWENGMIANMRRDKIELLSDALGVSIPYLMGREDNLNENSGEVSADLAMDKELTRYVKKIIEMTKNKKQRVYGYIDSLDEK